ncbi:hypothetical protein PROFUN_04054 [Planoprotostelium fungivorum]|uniref:Crossover junction endonuclease MUS81 n=1 Tax=Planoprotostelium fungivorum TaxID=1890364 RepID=A0A2P6NW97_9EUKA|nr:hypothetical protein PROFUN_04054 [Planoprotostelium fungivorum]
MGTQSDVNTLIKKELVVKEGSRFSLTETGLDLSRELYATKGKMSSADLLPMYHLRVSRGDARAERVKSVFLTGERCHLVGSGLKRLDVNVEKRSLELGDFIARSPDGGEEEIMEDLAASVEDGPYKEQKFRLKRCGITNIIYLAERSTSQEDTANYLAGMTSHLQSNITKGKTQHMTNLTFSEFSSAASR